ncbi:MULTISPECIES: ABC transporter ATP-binding protein [Clostridium]|uniref:ABC transporter ATP-binding protein n=1 Tax=Clostridium TaxID=1485 RepID=UPI00069DFA69|nr:MULTISPECIES: ABC transporter ATP-binding protein [Clostridium]KOF56308.1 ABC transporter ATP-binding protein [Clostridium sp. DMHC 10]MCD2347895.1 ABC transporter ATP-binding protein [Clostridium guangxiense]
MEKIIEMKEITKIFPGIIANNKVNFDLLQGETHVLLGENGAGKTTLMNVLYGLYQPESGEIYIQGTSTKINTPHAAIKLGIGMVHQHFMLINNFTVAENIILGMEPKKGLKIDMKSAILEVEKLSKAYGFNVNAKDKIEDLSVGQQQKVEILKALYRKARVLILDEPTAVLTPQEIEELANIISMLKKEGKSFILITHKLKEVMNMSDRITIIRRGEVIKTLNTKGTNIDELAEMMVGRKVNLKVNKSNKEAGEAILEINKLNAEDERGVKVVKDVDLTVKSGEIFGIAGVDGNGQSELIDILTGLRKAQSGSIKLNGKEVTGRSTREIMDEGVGHIPEDRHKRGLVLKFSLFENSILGLQNNKAFKNKFFLNYKKIKEHCRSLIKQFDVRTPSEEVTAASLSGGNQQKLIIAREIFKQPSLLIAAQPTRGLDVGAIEYIHKQLVSERENGKAVLLVSLELDEILSLSDRIGVMYDGKIVAVLENKGVDEKTLGILMAGGSINKDKTL